MSTDLASSRRRDRLRRVEDGDLGHICQGQNCPACAKSLSSLTFHRSTDRFRDNEEPPRCGPKSPGEQWLHVGQAACEITGATRPHRGLHLRRSGTTHRCQAFSGGLSAGIVVCPGGNDRSPPGWSPGAAPMARWTSGTTSAGSAGAGIRILDVGGGKYPAISPATKRELNLHVVGLDISAEELAQVRRAPTTRSSSAT